MQNSEIWQGFIKGLGKLPVDNEREQQLWRKWPIWQELTKGLARIKKKKKKKDVVNCGF